MAEFIKDIKWIGKTIGEEFRTMVTIKITIVPVILIVLGVASYLIPPLLSVPQWISVPMVAFFSVLFLLFSIARKARKMQEPKISLDWDGHFRPQGLNPYTVAMKIVNTSNINLTNIKVRVARIVYQDGSREYIMKYAGFWGEDVNTTSINPKNAVYALMGEYELSQKGEENLFCFNGDEDKKIGFPTLLFEVSGAEFETLFYSYSYEPVEPLEGEPQGTRIWSPIFKEMKDVTWETFKP